MQIQKLQVLRGTCPVLYIWWLHLNTIEWGIPWWWWTMRLTCRYWMKWMNDRGLLTHQTTQQHSPLGVGRWCVLSYSYARMVCVGVVYANICGRMCVREWWCCAHANGNGCCSNGMQVRCKWIASVVLCEWDMTLCAVRMGCECCANGMWVLCYDVTNHYCLQRMNDSLHAANEWFIACRMCVCEC